MRIIIASTFFLYALSCHAADPVSGRWQGSVQIPGRPLELTVDLDRNASGAWIGSLVIPSLNIKGAALGEITASDKSISFVVSNALGEPNAGQAKFSAQFDAKQNMTGTFSQAGNSTSFALHKTGTAQVDLPISSTALAKTLEGQWLGDYEINGVPRHVTLTVANHAAGVATAQLVIVGKKTNDVPVDLIRQDDALVTFHSNSFGMTYEGRVRNDASEIAGTLSQGAFDLALILRRPAKAAP